MPSILFIPDRFMDYRMWSDVPNQIQGRARAIHFDQREQIPWTETNGAFLAAAGRLAADGRFAVVAAAGQAARFGFAVAEAGLAKSLVLFHPYLNSMPDDVEVDFSDLEEILEPGADLLSLVHDPDPDPDFVRAACLQVVRDLAGPDLPPAQLELALAMNSDHALELFADLRATAAAMAAAGGTPLPDPPWITHPWLDRVGALTVPVTVVVTARGRGAGEAIARRARDAQVVVAGGSPGLAPTAERIRTAETLLGMLDRVS
jgi:hypothetical protein